MKEAILDHLSDRHAAFLHGAGWEGSCHLLDKLALKGQERVLEIGFGTGGSLVLFRTHFPDLQLVGLERSGRMLERARRRLQFCGISGVELGLLEEGSAFPFADQSFDVIYIESVLAILSQEQLEKTLAEVWRLLKTGGRFAFNESIWQPGADPTELRRINDFCRREFGIIQANDQLPDVEAWKSLLTDAGWGIEYCAAVEKYQASLPKHRQHHLSRLFTLWGRLTALWNRKHRQDARQLSQLLGSIWKTTEARLQSYILIASK
ncbi:MAG: class I SAM-dependent methyltransferase [Bacteroidota bacterium]